MDPSPIGELANSALTAASSTDVILLFVYVGAALFFSFLCSISEASLLSMTPSYIAGLRETQPKKAEALKKLRETNIDQSLAAILTVNTIAHTAGAVGAGSKATVIFGEVWFGLFSAVLTLLILFLTEIVPKTLGAKYWRQLAGFTVGYVRVLVKTMYPIIVVSEKLTRLIAGEKKEGDFNRDEFVAMASLGEEQGQLNDRESKIIQNLFLFKSVEVSSVMTPRIVMFALSHDLTVDQALKVPSHTPFSRIPIYEGQTDYLIGFVLREDLLTAQGRGQGDARISTFRRDLLAVSETASLSRLLDLFLDQRQHIAMVVSEYGETKGLVTLEDVVETLLGVEIVDEGDKVADMRQLARQLWERRAKRMGFDLDAPDAPPNN